MKKKRGPRKTLREVLGTKSKVNPVIFVQRKKPGPMGQLMCRAHLKNKKGDIFLCWNDEKYRSLYLGRRKWYTPAATAKRAASR